ncbi:MAG: YopX family protein [Ruminococcus sp.]|nr:YopX family protein [Ruminococcus sp.]
MREILFKGKQQKNREWIEGYYLKFYETLGNEVNYMIFAIDEERKLSQPYSVDPSTVCQYTNLNDANGRRIFEGDIVRCENDTGHIVFNGGKFVVAWKKSAELKNINLDVWHSDVEVVGSICDNPGVIGDMK